MKKNFDAVKEELDGHLDSINENTNEIQANYEYMCELDSKIDKLSERIDEITMVLRRIAGNALLPKEPEYQIKPLTRAEKEVFTELYTLEQEERAITYQIVARRLALTIDMVQNHVSNLIEKGVPICKKYSESEVYIYLDEQFKAIQTRKNLVGVHPITN